MLNLLSLPAAQVRGYYGMVSPKIHVFVFNESNFWGDFLLIPIVHPSPVKKSGTKLEKVFFSKNKKKDKQKNIISQKSKLFYQNPWASSKISRLSLEIPCNLSNAECLGKYLVVCFM